MSCFTLSGNTDTYYNGEYCVEGMMNGQGYYRSTSNNAYFYYYPGYWQLDYRDQDGSNDWYDGGCMVVDSADQYQDEFMSG